MVEEVGNIEIYTYSDILVVLPCMFLHSCMVLPDIHQFQYHSSFQCSLVYSCSCSLPQDSTAAIATVSPHASTLASSVSDVYLTTERIPLITSTQFTLICVRQTVKVSEVGRTDTGEVVVSINTGTTIVARRRATDVEVYFTVFALRGNGSVP